MRLATHEALRAGPSRPRPLLCALYGIQVWLHMLHCLGLLLLCEGPGCARVLIGPFTPVLLPHLSDQRVLPRLRVYTTAALKFTVIAPAIRNFTKRSPEFVTMYEGLIRAEDLLCQFDVELVTRTENVRERRVVQILHVDAIGGTGADQSVLKRLLEDEADPGAVLRELGKVREKGLTSVAPSAQRPLPNLWDGVKIRDERLHDGELSFRSHKQLINDPTYLRHRRMSGGAFLLAQLALEGCEVDSSTCCPPSGRQEFFGFVETPVRPPEESFVFRLYVKERTDRPIGGAHSSRTSDDWSPIHRVIASQEVGDAQRAIVDVYLAVDRLNLARKLLHGISGACGVDPGLLEISEYFKDQNRRYDDVEVPGEFMCIAPTQTLVGRLVEYYGRAHAPSLRLGFSIPARRPLATGRFQSGGSMTHCERSNAPRSCEALVEGM